MMKLMQKHIGSNLNYSIIRAGTSTKNAPLPDYHINNVLIKSQ